MLYNYNIILQNIVILHLQLPPEFVLDLLDLPVNVELK